MKESDRERIKLRTNLFNAMAVATYAIGVLAPVVTTLYGTSGSDGLTVTIVAVICILFAAALHYLGRKALGGLDDD